MDLIHLEKLTRPNRYAPADLAFEVIVARHRVILRPLLLGVDHLLSVDAERARVLVREQRRAIDGDGIDHEEMHRTPPRTEDALTHRDRSRQLEDRHRRVDLRQLVNRENAFGAVLRRPVALEGELSGDVGELGTCERRRAVDERPRVRLRDRLGKTATRQRQSGQGADR